MRILHDLFIINGLILIGMLTIWEDPFFLGMQLNPIIMQLRPSIEPRNASGDIIETACRLAVLIFLGNIRAEFVMYHVTGYHFVERLKHLALEELSEWEEFQKPQIMGVRGSNEGIRSRPFAVH